MKATLKYPILVFDPEDDMVWGFGQEKDFQYTTTRILKRSNYRAGVVVVDNTGMKYTIRRAYKTGWRGIHGWTGLQTGIINLENEYEDNPTQLSPDELREMMVERYLKHKDEEWFKEGWVNVGAFRRIFAKCRTIEELIGLVVCVPKFSLWERIEDYFFRGLFSMLGVMFLYMIWLMLKKAWLWITG